MPAPDIDSPHAASHRLQKPATGALTPRLTHSTPPQSAASASIATVMPVAETLMDPPTVSFVIPCLNESETIAACVSEIRAWAERSGTACEILIADNGSIDGSPEAAMSAGAKVVHVPQRGYGASVLAGTEAASAPIIVMMDADLSYDPSGAEGLLRAMADGADLAIGSRLNGTIAPGAMPALHRRLGTPTLTALTRLLFGGQLTDTQSGMRAFRREALLALRLRTTGMEFASEMIVRSLLAGLVVREAPIPFRRDGRSRPPHLRPWRDGWRHLRLLLLLSPRWTLGVPGLAIFVVGVALLLMVSVSPMQIGAITLDLHTLVVACLAVTVGYQAMTIAAAIRFNPLRRDLGPPGALFHGLARLLSFESCLWIGCALAAVGATMILWQTVEWASGDFGDLPIEHSLRVVLIGATVLAVGVQTVLVSVVSAMLALARL